MYDDKVMAHNAIDALRIDGKFEHDKECFRYKYASLAEYSYSLLHSYSK